MLATTLVLGVRRPEAAGPPAAWPPAAGCPTTSCPLGSGLAEATSVVERAVDRALLWGGEGSMAEARLASALAVIPQGVVVFDDDGDDRLPQRGGRELPHRPARRRARGGGDRRAGRASPPATDGAACQPRTVDLFGPPRRTLVLTAIPLHEGGRRLGVLVVIDDVTDRRRLEAVRRDFVANISHELKTPVGALGLLAETLLAEDDAAVAQRLAERMLAEAFRVGRTIDDLLELSRIEADEEARRDDVPVHLVIAEAVDRVRPAAEQQGITIEVEEPPPRLAVAGDRRQLVSATYNLLENAVKYSDPGSSVQVRARTDGRWVDIEVRGPRHRDPAARPRAGLRALLPGRSGPQPRDRRHRPRAGHRPPRRQQPRRRGPRRVHRRRRFHVHPATPGGCRAGRRDCRGRLIRP